MPPVVPTSGLKVAHGCSVDIFNGAQAAFYYQIMMYAKLPTSRGSCAGPGAKFTVSSLLLSAMAATDPRNVDLHKDNDLFK